MLQPSKFSRSTLDLQNTDLQAILADTALGRLWQSLSQLLRLPNDLVSFLLFLMVLSVLCGGLFLHIHLSAQIMQARIDIADQQALFEAIEQKNSEIAWQINQSSSLNNVKQRAVALGYVDMPDHQYIGAVQAEQALLPGSPVAAALGLESALAAEDSSLNGIIGNNNTQPLLASSASNIVAPSLNRTDSSTALLDAPPPVGMARPLQAGLENSERGWRQWIQGWLPFP